MSHPPVVRKDARLSSEGTYRYYLIRDFVESAPRRRACFVGLNPSTADAVEDDPTIRRCMSFAHAFGCNGLMMVNLFAYRATCPADLKAAAVRGVDVVGPYNRMRVRARAGTSHIVVACWGANRLPGMEDEIENFLTGCRRYGKPIHCLGTTKAGHPKHPLYLASNTPLTRWELR